MTELHFCISNSIPCSNVLFFSTFYPKFYPIFYCTSYSIYFVLCPTLYFISCSIEVERQHSMLLLPPSWQVFGPRHDMRMPCSEARLHHPLLRDEVRERHATAAAGRGNYGPPAGGPSTSSLSRARTFDGARGGGTKPSTARAGATGGARERGTTRPASAGAGACRGASPETPRPRPTQRLEKPATDVAAADSTSQQRAARPAERADGRGGAGPARSARRSRRRTRQSPRGRGG